MNNQLTVLIPTSPIPCHPSTEILDETIANIRKYTDAEIVIMFDGVHENLKHRQAEYERYKRNVEDNIILEKYGHCSIVSFETHTHQAKMTRTVLESVSTPLIMFCEHDTSPIGDIPFNDICTLVECDNTIDYVRFNIFDRILDEHEYLMLESITDPCLKIPYRRTIQWSQRPHIAKTGWYREILKTFFKPDEKTMIEDVMHGVVIEKHKELGIDIFGLAIYTPEGNQLRSYHSDGRRNDEKITYG